MPGPLGRAVIALGVSVALIAGYAFSFTFAVATPEPHRVPVAVVTAGTGAVLADRIERTHRSEYDVHRVDDRAGALDLIAERTVDAALVASPRSPHLLLAPAVGQTTTELLARRLPAAAGLRAPPEAEVVRPLARRDPNDTALDYAVFPILIFGLVLPLLLTSVAPALKLRQRLPLVGAYSLAGGLAVTLVSHVALDALPGPLGWEMLVAALALLAVASCSTALIGLLGPPGVVVGIVLFLILGNAASGTQLSWDFMPGLHRAAGPWLPPGCLAEALRNVAYFDGARVVRPLVVLAAYALVGLAAGVVLGDRQPAPQGDPEGPTPDSDQVSREATGASVS